MLRPVNALTENTTLQADATTGDVTVVASVATGTSDPISANLETDTPTITVR